MAAKNKAKSPVDIAPKGRKPQRFAKETDINTHPTDKSSGPMGWPEVESKIKAYPKGEVIAINVGGAANENKPGTHFSLLPGRLN